MANKNLFTSIQQAMTPKNVFDLSHDVKMSTKFGHLTPIMCLEAVPGDKFQISCESLLRFAPLVAPVMHHMSVTMHYFFVPNRILWPNWEKFITNDPSAPAVPFVTIDNTDGVYSLSNYIGCPLTQGSYNASALPFAAYQAIWNEYYRDQNLMAPIDYKLVDGFQGGNSAALKLMRLRAWEHDYFTSALPFAQKGGAVTVPGGPVELDPNWFTNGGAQNPPHFKDSTGSAGLGSIGQGTNGGVPNNPNIQVQSIPADSNAYDPSGSLIGTGTTVNDLRRSLRLQEWLERMARGGSRYIEVIKSHFNVMGKDARLQRPEYITGTKSPVVISEVLNTTGEQTGLPQGNMAGHGVSVTTGKYGSYRADEHGYLIGVMSILPKTAYQQGLPRHFSRTSPTEYYWPSFANIGEQEIKIKELYVDAQNPDALFGYTPRYSEYKYHASRVAGDFQTVLDYWHLGRKFANEPALNEQFIRMSPLDAQRIFAVQSGEDNLYAHVYNKVRAVRPMPRFGTPTI